MFASGAKVPQRWMPNTLNFNRPQLIQVRTIPRLGLLPVLIVEQDVLGLTRDRVSYGSGSSYGRIVWVSGFIPVSNQNIWRSVWDPICLDRSAGRWIFLSKGCWVCFPLLGWAISLHEEVYLSKVAGSPEALSSTGQITCGCQVWE